MDFTVGFTVMDFTEGFTVMDFTVMDFAVGVGRRSGLRPVLRPSSALQAQQSTCWLRAGSLACAWYVDGEPCWRTNRLRTLAATRLQSE